VRTRPVTAATNVSSLTRLSEESGIVGAKQASNRRRISSASAASIRSRENLRKGRSQAELAAGIGKDGILLSPPAGETVGFGQESEARPSTGVAAQSEVDRIMGLAGISAKKDYRSHDAHQSNEQAPKQTQSERSAWGEVEGEDEDSRPATPDWMKGLRRESSTKASSPLAGGKNNGSRLPWDDDEPAGEASSEGYHGRAIPLPRRVLKSREIERE